MDGFGFGEYRWQDHVVRPGWWRLDVLLAAVSISIATVTLEPGAEGNRATAARETAKNAQCQPDAQAAEVLRFDKPCESKGLVGSSPAAGARKNDFAGPSS